jgi:hypothetical protein
MWSDDSGTHWRRIPDAALRREAMNRAQRFNRGMEDVELEHDGTITVNFGSTGADIKLRRFDDEVFALFLHGYCGLLAWAIHQRTGLPLAVFTGRAPTESSWAGHAVVMVGEDKFLDITGVQSAANIHAAFPGKLRPEYSLVTPDKFAALIVEPQHRADPLSFLEPLERYIVEDFAEYLISQNKVG